MGDVYSDAYAKMEECYENGVSDGREKVLKKVKKTLKQLDRIAVDNGFNQKRIMFEDVQRGFGWVKLERKR